MNKTVIKWRLNEVMARHGIRATTLAETMDVSLNTVSNLRGHKMPRLTEQTLNSLLNALNSLRIEDRVIGPSDLIDYTQDVREE